MNKSVIPASALIAGPHGTALPSADPHCIVDDEFWARSELVRRVSGDQALILALIECYLAFEPELLTQLHNAIGNNDMEQAAFHLHSIKGAVANLGAVQLRALATRMESAAKQQDQASVLSLMSDFVSASELFNGLLRQYQQQQGKNL
jgi:HPt (histidine-containing phosphotransfer) domain-containing protein